MDTIISRNFHFLSMDAQNITLFDGREVRKIWHDDRWFFSIIDIVAILTDASNPRRYWSDLKIKLTQEGIQNELYENIVQLKLIAPDGKMRETDCADTETILRIIQSVPSPRAEPFKVWLAKVGYERMREVANPEIALNRSRELWQKHGRSEKWIGQRMSGQETRNKLTDYWSENGVKEGEEFAILTNIIHEEWADISVRGHRELK